MLVDAKDRFVHRMAATINQVMHSSTPQEMKDRFAGHSMADIKMAQAYAARARADAMKNKH